MSAPHSDPGTGKTLMEDELITRLLGRIALFKGEITKSLSRATKEGNTIAAMKDKGMTMQNLLLKGCVSTGAGHIEMASKAQRNLEEAVAVLTRMLAEVEVREPVLNDNCNQLIEKEERASETYSEKVSKVMLDTMQFFEPSANNSAASSRTTSPVRQEVS